MYLHKFSGYSTFENPQEQTGEKNQKNRHYHICTQCRPTDLL